MKQVFKKCMAVLLVGLMALPAMAEKELGIFNTVSIGGGISTTGIDVTLAAPITPHFALRGGVSFLPNFTFNTDVTATASVLGQDKSYPMEIEGGLKRTTGNLLLSYYPFKKAAFFLTAGAYFGGKSLVSISGHNDEIAGDLAAAGRTGITIGDQEIPVDKDGNVSGGLNVAAVRPYVGLGFGDAVPTRRVGFLVELGVQFHGTPELYTDHGTLTASSLANEDDTFSKIIDKLTVYPMLKMHVFFRAF